MTTQNINLKNDNIYSLFVKIAIPSSIGTIFQNLYAVVDSIFAGKMISESALAAIGQIFPIYFIIIALGVGLSIGTTSLIANSIGENNFDKSGKIFSQSFILSIIVSILVTIIGYNFSSSLITLNNSFFELIIFLYLVIKSDNFLISLSISLIPTVVNFCNLRSNIELTCCDVKLYNPLDLLMNFF